VFQQTAALFILSLLVFNNQTIQCKLDSQWPYSATWLSYFLAFAYNRHGVSLVSQALKPSEMYYFN
jgi:hypothetical protein